MRCTSCGANRMARRLNTNAAAATTTDRVVVKPSAFSLPSRWASSVYTGIKPPEMEPANKLDRTIGRVKAIRKIFATSDVPKKWARAFSLASPKNLVPMVMSIKSRDVCCMATYFKIPKL